LVVRNFHMLCTLFNNKQMFVIKSRTAVLMGGEALAPVKAQCSTVGECQGGKKGVGGWGGEHPHRNRERREGIGSFQRGNQERE
jgi:hypothetical protein